MHPTVCVLPAALAVAEVQRKEWQETCCWLISLVWKWNARSRKPSPRATTRTDSIPPAPVVSLARPQPARRLKGFDAVHTVRAFAIAASHAAGLRENFGTMMKAVSGWPCHRERRGGRRLWRRSAGRAPDRFWRPSGVSFTLMVADTIRLCDCRSAGQALDIPDAPEFRSSRFLPVL